MYIYITHVCIYICIYIYMYMCMSILVYVLAFALMHQEYEDLSGCVPGFYQVHSWGSLFWAPLVVGALEGLASTWWLEGLKVFLRARAP